MQLENTLKLPNHTWVYGMWVHKLIHNDLLNLICIIVHKFIIIHACRLCTVMDSIVTHRSARRVKAPAINSTIRLASRHLVK